ncbi:multidrug resistance protein fnx1 [Cryptococcus deuterogattii 99/473]|uniref:Multidrug resistance protein fnx1 n=1 Tax=Cryptococcus deuterogattii Ram5 TaxID=1296110 RepID=A0A0D0V428_9TREE|nr:multidrug resistance protein fnx1 [Cryptococcus deuterogattii LA55]KIR41364.1 multidrug resistance protein fnx1 [Cryptococcus deuterogattii Ram5]KIR91190.1 multidrug resistance protein fnx1 [Cryptococcus deuterogattii CBS 10090]KIY54173.1 multidrug resistance protein fnx1 [Cryptococcus deuterogattii 99/473]
MTLSERERLLRPAPAPPGTTLYSEPDHSKDIKTTDEHNLSYNKVGLSARRFWILCASMWIASFLNAFDGTVVATLLGPISSSFKATNMASWLGTAYMLSVCCFTPIYGRLCDIIGRQGSMLLALAIFTTGNLLCAIAPSMEALIAARALAGMGGGGLSTVGSTIMSDIVPITHRGIFQGLANLAFGGGMSLGAPIGGLINDSLSWRWAFWVQIPALLFASYLIHSNVRYDVPSRPSSGAATPNPAAAGKQTAMQLFKRIDFLGCFLLAGWVGAALIAVSLNINSTATNAHNWSDPIMIVLFTTSAVFFVLFLLVELKWAAEPVMPFELLVSRTPVAVAINNFVLSVVNFAILYSVPLYFTAVRQMSASSAGAHLIPNSFVGAIGSLGAGLVVRRSHKYYWLNTFCACFGVIGCFLISTWNLGTSEWMLWTNMSFTSFAMGAVTTLTIVALIADVGPEHVAIATSLSYVFRTIGQVLGVALSGALTQAVLTGELKKRIQGPNAEQIIASIRESSASIQYLPEPLRSTAIASYQKGLHAVFVCTVVLSVITLLSGLGIREVDMKLILSGGKPALLEQNESEEEEG